MLAIDPASREAGVALFKNAELIGVWQLSTDEPTWGQRLCDLSVQFGELPIPHEDIEEVAIECLKGASNSPMLNAISGVFIQYLPKVNLKPKSFITPSSWKAVARKVTGEKEPKGYSTLSKMGTYPEMSDDCADAVLIGLTYLSKK